jgi:DNA-binding GntR family transcriptional regulator
MVETVLSEQLGVSRTPVREALSRLTVEGWLEARRNKGVVVAGIEPEQVRERFILREILEGYAAREAAKAITAEEVGRLEAICNAADRAIDEDRDAEFARLDGELHDGILRVAGNQTLLAMWHQHLHPARHAVFALGQKDHRRHLVEQHRRILSAMSAHNPDLAEKAIRQHIHYAMEVYLRDDQPDSPT